MRKILTVALLCVALLSPFPAFTQGSVDAELNAKIRKEGMENSQILRSLHFLADVYGARLTGSPNHKNAAEWAVKQMAAWGFQNGHLEPWDFGHPGWLNERHTAHINAPVKDTLECEVLAWTPSTNGTVTAQAVQLVWPERAAATTGQPGPGFANTNPTQEELIAYLNGVKDKVKSKIVLAGKTRFVPVNMTPPAKRRPAEQWKSQYDPNNPNPGQGFGRRGGPPQGQNQEQGPARLTAQQLDAQVDKFLLENGALVRINDAGREHGQIIAFNNRSYDPATAPPTVVMRNEDYGRIARILADGTPVELEFNIVNRNYPEGRTSYNTISEIQGTDKKDEVIMLGGHLDSWHAATGATDNAIGCSIMMEAARILKTIGVKPRRTIRVALWSGEEEGLLGSQAYVKEHFGTAENPKPEFFKFGGYFNIDSGTGQAHGAGVFGPPEAAAILRQALAPFEDLGVYGALASRSRNLGGTDSTSFNQAGLPGIGMSQDPIEYNTHTHHTNLDNYERIIEDDVKKSAVAIAGALYVLAMRDEMLPRFSKEQMPAPPPARAETRPATTPAQTARPANQTPPPPPPLQSPEVHADSRVTFRLRAPNAKEVLLAREGAPRVALQKDEQGVWSVTTAQLEPDLYGYSFVADGVSLIDPSNFMMKPNLLSTQSVVRVPGPASLPWEINSVRHGAIHHHFYKSGIVGDERDFYVYTPPGYDPNGKKLYPVLYLLHGFSDDASGWTAVGRAHVILDNLIAQGKAKPMLIVMTLGYGAPEIVSRNGPGLRDATIRQRNYDRFRDALLTEVIPEVERVYRVSKDRNSRAIAGLSMGGAESLFVGLNALNRFAWIGAFSSGGLSEDFNATFPALDAKANAQLHLLWIACGTEDRLIETNRKLRDWLKSKDVRHTAIETAGAHTWMVWRRNLANFAPLLFQEKTF